MRWARRLLAAGDSLRNFEFDWPATPARWAITIAALVALVAVAVGVYRLDTRGLGRGWRVVADGAAAGGHRRVARDRRQSARDGSGRWRSGRRAWRFWPTRRFRCGSPTRRPAPPIRPARQRNRADAVRSTAGRFASSGGAAKAAQRARFTRSIRVWRARPAVVLPAQAERTPTGPSTLAQVQPSRKAKSAPPAVQRPPESRRVDWNEILRPRGLETRLGEAVIQAVQQLGGRTLSGIVVISDGDSNAGIEPSTAQEVAKGANARLITIGVGSTEPPVNLQVVSIQAPSDVHVGDPYEFSAFIQGYGLAGKTATVELLSRPEGDEKTQPKVIETREVPVREDGAPIEVRFRQTPTVAGGVELFVRVRPPAGVRELSDDDNERRKTVNVIDRKLHVLVVASGPMREYRFLHTMLNRHSSIDVDIWLQTVSASAAGQVSQESKRLLVEFPKTAAELFDYDVIVAFDPDWSRIPAEGRKFLMNWVSEHGGGLILVAGDIYTPQLAASTDDAAQGTAEALSGLL